MAAAAAAGAALVALAPVVFLVGGAFGAAATAGFGLVAMVGTLVLGFGGLGDAWSAYGQKSAGGGRSAAMAAREVKAATDALADAQRAALRAQEDVGRAREEEAERLEDLSRSLAGAMLDEEGAALAVRRAQERLKEARRSGSGLDRAEAALGLEKAKHTLLEVQDRVKDLAREKEEADRKGVEGSDRVQNALERQLQAQRGVEAATNRLADAQRGSGAGGVNKFAEAMGKLSANAQAFMHVLFGLKPAFDDLKKSVQDRLFEGMDTSFKNMATKWLPQLKEMLGELGGNLNRVFKGLMDKVSTPQFISDIRFAVAGFGSSLERLGEGAQALLGALGRLARAAVPFFEKLSDLIAGTFENFEKWIQSADESGELKTFMEDAAKALQDIWTIGGLVIDIFTEMLEILMPSSKQESGTFFEGLKIVLGEIRDWLADPQNQEKVRGFIDGAREMGIAFLEAAMAVAGWIDRIDGWIDKIGQFGDSIASLKDRITSINPFDALKESFRAGINWIIDRWNGLRFTLPSINVFGQQIGGGTIETRDIQRFAHGGIGGGLARVAERGRELINTPDGMLLAMPHGSTVIPNGTTEAMLGRSGGGEVTVTFDFQRAGMDDMRRWLMKLVDVYGDGNVQVALGKARSA